MRRMLSRRMSRARPRTSTERVSVLAERMRPSKRVPLFMRKVSARAPAAVSSRAARRTRPRMVMKASSEDPPHHALEAGAGDEVDGAPAGVLPDGGVVRLVAVVAEHEDVPRRDLQGAEIVSLQALPGPLVHRVGL